MEIKINKITKVYNRQTVLNIDKLSIEKGEFIGLIGNNGAGKTTLLRLLVDQIKANTGHVFFRNQDISKTESWKWYTSAYIDSNFLIDFLTPEEYFQFIATNYKTSNLDIMKTLHLFKDFMNNEILGKHKFIRYFSTGNQQKIGIIGAIISKPDILILDEPFNFLDPSSQYFISEYLTQTNKQNNTTIIISSHNLHFVNNVSSRIILLEKGCILKDIHNINAVEKDDINQYFQKSQIKI